MFYITISNGLIKGDHRKRMGTAVWEFMWCIDKVTTIDKQGYGLVLGGKPINLIDLATDMSVSEDTVSRNINSLQDEGYLKLKRTPYGIIIAVSKAKKRFRKSSESNTAEMSNLSAEMSNVIKTDTEDSTERHTRGNPREIEEVLKAFEVVNPNCKRMYGYKTQRDAVRHLIDDHGLSTVLKVIEILPKTNELPYITKATTPVQLRDRWASLESDLKRLKAKKVESKSKVAF